MNDYRNDPNPHATPSMHDHRQYEHAPGYDITGAAPTPSPAFPLPRFPPIAPVTHQLPLHYDRQRTATPIANLTSSLSRTRPGPGTSPEVSSLDGFKKMLGSSIFAPRRSATTAEDAPAPPAPLDQPYSPVPFRGSFDDDKTAVADPAAGNLVDPTIASYMSDDDDDSASATSWIPSPYMTSHVDDRGVSGQFVPSGETGLPRPLVVAADTSDGESSEGGDRWGGSQNGGGGGSGSGSASNGGSKGRSSRLTAPNRRSVRLAEASGAQKQFSREKLKRRAFS
ncbi:hypothetical protein BDK51DRAFT_48607, partial [Blyttiomyces helicus]